MGRPVSNFHGWEWTLGLIGGGTEEGMKVAGERVMSLVCDADHGLLRGGARKIATVGQIIALGQFLENSIL